MQAAVTPRIFGNRALSFGEGVVAENSFMPSLAVTFAELRQLTSVMS